MHLERVELQGFKSFTRRAEVSFCPNFTVVTGPNGSGKSNVLDAVCFALTEDDLSHLRVRSMQELVSTDASVDKATVVLTFTADQAAGGAEPFSTATGSHASRRRHALGLAAGRGG